MAINIETDYSLGDVVYLLTDEDQKPRILGQVIMDLNQSVQWQLLCGTQKTWHYEDEFTTNKSYVF